MDAGARSMLATCSGCSAPTLNGICAQRKTIKHVVKQKKTSRNRDVFVSGLQSTVHRTIGTDSPWFPAALFEYRICDTNVCVYILEGFGVLTHM